MRRDSLFYRLFQQSPSLLFELVDQPPANARQYRFDSVAVKEAKFEIDGVFLPPETDPPGVVYFCEVQFQRDDRLYERLFGELFLYFYRNRDRFSDWRAVVIYPSRSTEQRDRQPYWELLSHDRVQRIYLDEFTALSELPLGLALMVLTTLSEPETAQQARTLIQRTEQASLAPPEQRAIIEMIITIVVYRFTTLTRREVEAMLGIRLEETRVYQEAKDEGRQEGRQQGRQEGVQEGERSLILRQLTRRIGELSSDLQAQIGALSIEQLDTLGEDLLDFRSISDLQQWLDRHSSKG